MSTREEENYWSQGVKSGRGQGQRETVKAIVAWLRTPVPGTMCDDQSRDNAIADAIERGDWKKS